MGLAIGPTLGSLIYDKVGYENTFIIFGGLLVLGGILIFFTLPNRLNTQYRRNENMKNSENDMARKNSNLSGEYTKD